MTEILIKRLSKDVALPKYETEGSSGLDLAANIDKQIKILPGKILICLFILAAKSRPDEPSVLYLGKDTSFDSLLINISVIN